MNLSIDAIYETLQNIGKDGVPTDNLPAAILIVSFFLGIIAIGHVIFHKLLSGGPKPLLNPDEFVDVTVSDKKQLTHNTYLFRLGFPDPQQPFGLPIGQHVSFKLLDSDQKEVMRSYTPVSDVDQLGYADFVIKVYPTGKMTQLLEKLSVGDRLSLRGPKGRFKYQPNMKKSLGMIAGGTGITPMFQVMSALFKDFSDATSVNLVYGNVTVDDILLRKELHDLAKQQQSRLSIYHVLNSPPEAWDGGSGFISPEIIKANIAPPSSDVLVLLCGPPPMLKAMNTHLLALGYTEDMIFMF